MSKAQSSSKTAPKNISVFLRVRPPVPREKDHTFENIKYSDDPCFVSLYRKSGSRKIAHEYQFNRVFKPSCTQLEVYNHYAKNAVDAAFDGQHGVLFVYGQTGSGKTFTISNDDPKNMGVLQQSMRVIWEKIAQDTQHDYACSVSYVQLYNEILTDLLDEKKGRVRIQMGNEGRGDVVLVAESTGVVVGRSVSDYESTMATFREGMKRKEMDHTSMNNTSSRSHTIFTFYIKKSTKVSQVKVDVGESETTSIALEGRLVLCDLAGSERVSKTHAEGKTLNEATHINGSLLVLGKVVAALTEKNSQHAPFRESKLTRILQYSLLGNGNTSLVVNISPSDDNTEESLSAVYFGQRAIQIKQDAKRHEVLDYKALYTQLMAELDAKNDGTLADALQEERDVYEDRIAGLQEQVQTLTDENGLLKQENTALRAGVSPEKVAAAVANVDGGSGNWAEVNAHLREMIQARDEKINTINDERVRLAMLLSQEKRTCFQLAHKMQAVSLQYMVERKGLVKRLDELAAELAAAKGTDYLSAVGNFSPATDGTVDGGASPRFPADETPAAREMIAALRQERIELIVYQSKAEKAIRLLAAEKRALEEKLEKLNKK
ncbi:kinesin [Strigomonas culicis]|uniref:Kinesin-like protein n=2 Tax=Strigomonas culicis TaxID=28005 RepID=S9V0F3_9TRYP|nr:kinesin [Strigomonas culicis]|eukprot:EPY20386.1 kinesin [Strigomonas culicis]